MLVLTLLCVFGSNRKGLCAGAAAVAAAMWVWMGATAADAVPLCRHPMIM